MASYIYVPQNPLQYYDPLQNQLQNPLHNPLQNMVSMPSMIQQPQLTQFTAPTAAPHPATAAGLQPLHHLLLSSNRLVTNSPNTIQPWYICSDINIRVRVSARACYFLRHSMIQRNFPVPYIVLYKSSREHCTGRVLVLKAVCSTKLDFLSLTFYPAMYRLYQLVYYYK